MLRYLFLFLITIHGLIHLLGFLKAFQLADISQLTKAISRPEGLFWLLATLMFLATAVLYLGGNPSWPVIGLAAIVLSQVLIFFSWQDAKFGTIANVIVLLVAIPALGARQFEQSYRRDVREGLQRTNELKEELLTEKDLEPLPEPVQKYLRFSEVVGKPKVWNMRAVFKGEMRGKEQYWFAFTSEQYSFFDEPTRLFFMKAKVKGLPTIGYHSYLGEHARMLIKVLSLFPAVDLDGEDMFKTETVTVFNDMCLLAPATLIDDRIQWETLDAKSVRATFTNRGVTISAILYFDEKGRLVDFSSEDRLDVNAMKQYRFTTPVSDYQEMDGRKAIRYGEAVWHYPEGPFVYGKFDVQSVSYNVKE